MAAMTMDAPTAGISAAGTLPDADCTARLLQDLIAFKSVSGGEAPLVHYLQRWAEEQGLIADCFETSEAALPDMPCTRAKHLPLADRPTLVLRIAGCGNGRSILFNAHSDVVDAPEFQQWRHDPWTAVRQGDRLYGRGACDTKGPLVSALLALVELKRQFPQGLPGDVLLEIVPGEEDCVGLGTLTSVARGYKADAAVILEPTEGRPRCSSRAGLRFQLMFTGRAVHGTVKWLGHDALADARLALAALDDMQAAFQAPDSGECAGPLTGQFAAYPFLRPITVDRIQGGTWQGMVIEQVSCAGYFELLPDDDISRWKKRFTDELQSRLQAASAGKARCGINFTEEYTGHHTRPDHPLCVTAWQAVSALSKKSGEDLAKEGWCAFNSGCEAGLRWGLTGTPTLVWGPGSLAQAHGADEYVDISDVRKAAREMAELAIRWTHLPR